VSRNPSASSQSSRRILPWGVPGHIPGAANIPWGKAAKDDGTFKSADELKALYEAEGITPDREVIAYCQIGERSSHTWFALQELLGQRAVLGPAPVVVLHVRGAGREGIGDDRD